MGLVYLPISHKNQRNVGKIPAFSFFCTKNRLTRQRIRMASIGLIVFFFYLKSLPCEVHPMKRFHSYADLLLNDV